jgi:phosphatidylserine/phosphatidylglycerophosphate/cardiolipin synthase-like enzyme
MCGCGARRASVAFGALILIVVVALALWNQPSPALQRAPATVRATETPAATIGTPGASDVDLIVWPDDGEAIVIDRVASARQRVLMKMYLLTDSRLADALAQARVGGADVRVMIEPEPIGMSGAAAAMIERLRESGVDAKYTSPEFRFTHEKSIVIDDGALILTANMTRRSATSNREFGLAYRAVGDVDEIASAFEADWRRNPFVPSSANLVWSPINARERIGSVIDLAQRTLDVYAPSAQDEEQLGQLVDAAGRGVRVRLLTSAPDVDGETGDGSGDYGLDLLQRGGVEVRVLEEPYVHAKVFAADHAVAFVGSQNISTTSLDYNRELGLILSDPDALRRLSATFMYDWDRASER